jgi:hypothetical protein
MEVLYVCTETNSAWGVWHLCTGLVVLSPLLTPRHAAHPSLTGVFDPKNLSQ